MTKMLEIESAESKYLVTYEKYEIAKTSRIKYLKPLITAVGHFRLWLQAVQTNKYSDSFIYEKPLLFSNGKILKLCLIR